MDTHKVVFSKEACRNAEKLPSHIATRLLAWIEDIKEVGLQETRKTKGYHDKPLKGRRKGQRSIRLNRSYRAIYTEHDNGQLELNHVEIKEVNKHEY